MLVTCSILRYSQQNPSCILFLPPLQPSFYRYRRQPGNATSHLFAGDLPYLTLQPFDKLITFPTRSFQVLNPSSHSIEISLFFIISFCSNFDLPKTRYRLRPLTPSPSTPIILLPTPFSPHLLYPHIMHNRSMLSILNPRKIFNRKWGLCLLVSVW